jgi:hypothetical protein
VLSETKTHGAFSDHKPGSPKPAKRGSSFTSNRAVRDSITLEGRGEPIDVNQLLLRAHRSGFALQTRVAREFGVRQTRASEYKSVGTDRHRCQKIVCPRGADNVVLIDAVTADPNCSDHDTVAIKGIPPKKIVIPFGKSQIIPHPSSGAPGTPAAVAEILKKADQRGKRIDNMSLAYGVPKCRRDRRGA